MAELSLSLPVKGEEAPGADAKVNAAFTEIQTQFNGKITDVNIETNRALVKTNNHYETKTFTKAELEAGTAEFSATRIAFVQTENHTLAGLEVGGVVVTANRPYLVPPTQKIKGTTAEASITYTFLLL